MEVSLKVPDDELLQPGEHPAGGGQVVLHTGSIKGWVVEGVLILYNKGSF